MSVAVLIDYIHAEAGRPTYVPVATEGVFSRYWLPAAATLGCTWVPLFATGTSVEPEFWPEVRREFERLRDHFAATATRDRHDTEQLRERSRLIVQVLAGLDAAEVRDLFIG